MEPNTQQKSTHMLTMMMIPNDKSVSYSLSTSLNLQIPFQHVHKISTTVISTFQENYVLAPLQKFLFKDLITREYMERATT